MNTTTNATEYTVQVGRPGGTWMFLPTGFTLVGARQHVRRLMSAGYAARIVTSSGLIVK